MKLDNVILETDRDGQELATNVWGTNLISRTINEDPLSLNLYTYCHNNPIEYYDPTGHNPLLIIAAIGAGIGVAVNFAGDIIGDGKVNRGLKSYGKSAVEGAIFAIGAEFLPAAITFEQVVQYSLALGGGAYATTNKIFGDKVDQNEMINSAEISAFFSSAGYALNKTALGNWVKGKASQAMKSMQKTVVNKGSNAMRDMLKKNPKIKDSLLKASKGKNIIKADSIKSSSKLIDEVIELPKANKSNSIAEISKKPINILEATENKVQDKFKIYNEYIKDIGNPYEMMKKGGVPSTLDDIDRAALDAGKYKMHNAAIKGASDAVEWTNQGYKHFPQKNISWKDIIKSTKNGPAKYNPGTEIEALERMVWEKGTTVTNGKTWRVMGFDDVIGASAGAETKYMRVEMSGGTIHGHPITKAEYKKLIK